MKIDEIRKKQEELIIGRFDYQDENDVDKRWCLEIGESWLSVHSCWRIIPDKIAKELRDWLCELYGLPKEK